MTKNQPVRQINFDKNFDSKQSLKLVENYEKRLAQLTYHKENLDHVIKQLHRRFNPNTNLVRLDQARKVFFGLLGSPCCEISSCL